jgi:penicillin-binding protein 2
MLTPVDPPQRPSEERPQSPQLALRVAVLGGIAVLLFSVLFFRLWVLQVLSVQEFQAQATENRERTVEVPAPRGMIVDRKGRPLVRNRPGDRVTFDLSQDRELAEACGIRPYGAIDTRPDETITVRRNKAIKRSLEALPKKAQKQRTQRIKAARAADPVRVWAGCGRSSDVLVRLARLTKTPLSDFEDAIHFGLIRSPFEPVTLLTDAPRELVFFLKEHGRSFQGVRILRGSVRYYPNQEAGAHLYGELAQISAAQLEDQEAYPGAEAGDTVGIGGIERTYDRFLRGRDGELRLRVDAQGNPEGTVYVSRPTEAGSNVRLTLDLDLQEAAEEALKEAIARSQVEGVARKLSADGGSIVALDPRNGAVLAMASFPTFNPNLLQGKTAEKERQKLSDEKGLGRVAPLFNRSISGRYPPGSTYKPVTAIAAMQSGLANPGDLIGCPGSLTVDGQRYLNFEYFSNTSMALPQALTESCDTYFYQLGKRLYDATPKDGSAEPQPLWGRRLGFGQATGIDIGGESAGVLPDIEYKRENAPPGDLITNRWTSGDAILQSIGQGDLEVTPLQVATLYSALANGGTLVKPHIAEKIERPDGTKLADLPAPARRKVNIDPFVLSSIRAGLLGATHDDSGTADATYASFEPAVAGKTGTAQKAGKRDYAWFAGYAPADAPEIVVVAIIEQGGFGGDIAAPAAARVFAKYFVVDPPEWPPPSRTDEREPPPPDAPTWVLGPDGQLVFTDDPDSVQLPDAGDTP